MATSTFIWIQRTLGPVHLGSLGMALSTFFLATPLLLLSHGRSPETGRKADAATEQVPLWRVDLRSFGYEGYKLPKEFPSHSVLEPISFSSDNTLIASFLTRGPATIVPHRHQPDAILPVQLHAVFLNAETGKSMGQKKWSAPYPGSIAIVATHDGQFIVVNREHLSLYSRNFELNRELTLSPPPGPQGDIQMIEVSPQRGSFLIVYFRGKQRINSINTSNLRLQRSWGGPLVPESVSDRKLAISNETYLKSAGVIIHEVLLQSGDGSWRTFCRMRLGYDPDMGCDYPQFVSGDVLAFFEPHTLSLAPVINGDIARIAQFHDDEWLGRPLRVSANGKRFAVSIWKHKGGSELFDIDYHSLLRRIMVFDVPSRQWIYILDAKKQKIKTISGLALSPDGSMLGLIDQDGILQVYQIPDATSPTHRPGPPSN